MAIKIIVKTQQNITGYSEQGRDMNEVGRITSELFNLYYTKVEFNNRFQQAIHNRPTVDLRLVTESIAAAKIPQPWCMKMPKKVKTIAVFGCHYQLHVTVCMRKVPVRKRSSMFSTVDTCIILFNR